MDNVTRSDSVEGLGQFLRARRGRLSPADAGLPSAGRRRVPGLRRDEVAALTGVSLSYYSRLEQGRELSPSIRVLDAMARVLRLGEEDTRELFRLAQPQLAAARSPPPGWSVSGRICGN